MSLIYCHKCYGATQCVCETPADKSPPREFWIYQDKIDHDDIVSSIEPQYEKDIYTHVIEHSAYLAVKEKCAQLDAHNNRLIDESCKIIKERDKLQQELEAARAECSGMGKFLQSGIVLSYDEYDSWKKQLSDAKAQVYKIPEESEVWRERTLMSQKLADAQAQIKDYEETLAKYPANSHAYNILKKYKGEN